MRKILILGMIGVGIILGVQRSVAQTYPIEVNLQIPPPYPSNLDAYFDYLDRGLVQIYNTNTTSMEVFFKVRLAEENNLISLSGPETQNESITISPGMNLLSSSQVREIFANISENDFHSNGLSDQQWTDFQLSKQLPEGAYSMCIYAYNEQNVLVSDPEGNGCMNFEITFAERPIISSPWDEDTIPAIGNYNVMWTHFLTNANALSRTEYVLKIIDLTEQEIENVGNAMLDPGISPEFEENVGVLRSKFIQDIVEYPLVQGHRYAARVTAIDPLDEIAYQYGGHSEIVTFVYGKAKVEEEDDYIPPLAFPTTPTLSTDAKCSPEYIVELPTDTASVVLKKIKKGGEYKFGKLVLAVSSIEKGDTTNGYWGEGFITMKIRSQEFGVNVNFKGIKVNAQKEVFAGVASGRDDKLNELDDKVADIISGTTDVGYKEAAVIAGFTRLSSKMGAAKKGVAISLPIGIDSEIKGDTMVVGITQMVFSPSQASLTALFSFQNKNWGDKIPTLGAQGVCFDAEGMSKNVKLILAKDYPIPQTQGDLVLKKYEESEVGIKGTYVLLEEGAFKEGMLKAEIAIPTSVLLPEKENGQIDSGQKAKITIQGRFESTENFILEATISPCQIPGLDGFSFELQKGFMDMSETANPPGIKFPEGYGDTSGVRWKGAWFSAASLKAPDGWGLSDDGERATLSLNNFIKDNSGVSVVGQATDILGIEKGEIAGFAVSVDTLRVDIIRNQFKQIGTFGKLRLPILPENKYLYYRGLVDRPAKQDTGSAKQEPLSMTFTIKPEEKGYDIDWLHATLQFDKTTQILLMNNAKDKGLDVTMNGTLKLKSEPENTDGPKLEIPGLRFEGMKITKYVMKDGKPVQNEKRIALKERETIVAFTFIAPVLSQTNSVPKPGTNSEGNTEKSDEVTALPAEPLTMNGFNVKLDSLKLDVAKNASGNLEGLTLSAVTTVSLVKASISGSSNEQGFAVSATGKFSIRTVVKGTKPKGMTFSVEPPQIDSLAVFGECKALTMTGVLVFSYGKAPFGHGVAGKLEMKTDLLNVKLDARFGNTGEYEYWYVFGEADRGISKDKKDGSFTKLPPIAIIGALRIYGFHGGAYYHMKEDVTKPEPLDRFKPNKENYLGLKAGITFTVSDNPKDFFARATIGFEFSESGGLDNINLEGDAYFMKKEMMHNPIIDDDGSKVDGVQAHLNGKLNFKSGKSPDLSLDMAVYAKISTAAGTFKGIVNKKNKLAQASLLVRSDKWHLYMGEPKAPGKGRFDVTGISIAMTGSAYIMMGNESLPSAVLDKDIQKYLGKYVKGLSGSTTDSTGIATRKNSGGFAMGATLKHEMHLKAAILYADFYATIGFDLSLLDVENIECTNLGGAPLGMNGKYAKGQVYGGFEGDIGLDIDIFFYSGKISLVNLQAAMLLKGGLPNPVYVSGVARMSYSVLGGLIRGSTGFNVSFGTICNENKVHKFGTSEFIADVTPDNNTSNVSVFAKQRVSFNSKIGKDYIYKFTVPDEDTTKTKKVEREYRVLIDEVSLIEVGTKGKVKCNQRFIDSTEFELKSESMLKGSTEYEFSIKLKAETRLAGDEEWKRLLKKDKKPWEESDKIWFTTGVPPNYISKDNIAIQYPFAEPSVYFVENNTRGLGFIVLLNEIDYLLKIDNQPNQPWHSKLVVKFSEGASQVSKKIILETPLVVNGRVITFDMPTDLPLDKHVWILIDREFYANDSFDNTSAKVEDKMHRGDTLSVLGQVYKNYDVVKPNSIRLFQNIFKISEFKSFEAMMNSSKRQDRVVSFYGRNLGPLEVRNTSSSMRLTNPIKNIDFIESNKRNHQLAKAHDYASHPEQERLTDYSYYYTNLHASWKIDADDNFNRIMELYDMQLAKATEVMGKVFSKHGIDYENLLDKGGVLDRDRPTFGEYQYNWYFGKSYDCIQFRMLAKTARGFQQIKPSIDNISSAELKAAFDPVWGKIDNNGSLTIRPPGKYVKVTYLYQVPFLTRNDIIGKQWANDWFEHSFDFNIKR